MPLILTVRNIDRFGGAAPQPLRLDRRGAVIGRAPSADWPLPDDRNTVSSRHCEIAFRDGSYLIADSSTNGTYVNDERITAPRRLGQGDRIGIGPYELLVGILPDVGAPDPPPPPAAQRTQAPAAVTVVPAQPASAPVAGAAEHLLRGAGLRRADVRAGDAEILAGAGALLGRLTAGTATLLAARARAMAELGAAADADGANPLKRGGAPGATLAQLLGAAQHGERAVAAAFGDLEAHQLATLKAMQGAMKATLDRFSPAAIRSKAGAKAGDATLWQAYESAFAGSGQASDDSFIEVFAREFRAAYEAIAKR